MEHFRQDVELVFNNCRQFNPPGTFPFICADIVEAAFRREWSKISEKKLSWAEKRGMQGIMTAFAKDELYVAISFQSH